MRSSKSKAILVTGGAGFIGSNLVKRLLIENEFKILVIDNLKLGKNEFLDDNSRILFHDIDLSIEEKVKIFFKDIEKKYSIEEIWHMAANSDIPAGTLNPIVDFKDTFLTTFNLINSLNLSHLKKFHFASSSAIYGDHGEIKIKENSAPLFPISNYGSFKLSSEAILSSFVERNRCKLYIYRFPNVVGTPATHGVIYDFINRLIKNPNQLNVFGNGKQKKQYMHVSDLVNAMIIISSKSDEKRNVFNIGPLDDGIEVSEIAKILVSNFFEGADINFGEENRGWLGDIPKYRYSVDALLKLNWNPSYPSSRASVRIAMYEIYKQLIQNKK